MDPIRKIPKPTPQDRLSSLPKSLLLHILSFLPTKDAVKTGTLSKHWLYLWTSLSVLDFHNPNYLFYHKEDEDSGPIVTFIDRTLILHNAPKIQKLSIRLLYELEHDSNIDLWLRLATRKKVEELKLDLGSYTDSWYVLPQFLLECESLLRLNLISCRIIPDRRINWENLESLSVSNAPLHDDAIREIALGCPSLKFLELQDCLSFVHLDINCTSLRELVIDGYSVPGYTVDISVPYVQSLSILGVMTNIHIVNAESLIDAKLDYMLWVADYDDEYEESLMLKEILDQLNHVRDLILGPSCIRVLSRLEEKEKVLPSLQSKCKCLTLDTKIDKSVLPVVAGLLESLPDLEILTIDMNCCDEVEFVSKELLDSCIFDWKNYFKCSLLLVKTVKIVNFGPGEHEMELVQVLLKNARVLKNMVIFLPILGPQWESSQELREIATKLLDFPRCSSDAVVLLS